MVHRNRRTVYAPNEAIVLGHAVSFEEVSGPIPDRFEEALTIAARFGKGMANHPVSWKSTSKPLQVGARLLRSAASAAPSLGANESPWNLVFKFAFWAAAAHASEPTPDMTRKTYGPSIYGSQSQRLLTRALLHLDTASRRALYEFCTKWIGRESYWIRDYVGAMSVARTAGALSELGFAPILPTAYVDSVCQVDLLAHTERDPGWFFCLQVKSDRSGPSSALPISMAWGPQDLSSAGRMRSGARTLMRVACLHRATFVLVTTGVDALPSWDLAPPEGLRELLVAVQGHE